MKNMLDLLSEKPVIGIVSGLGSGGIFTIQDIMLNESILKIVAGFGVWVGAMVASLTLLLKVIEVVEKIRRR